MFFGWCNRLGFIWIATAALLPLPSVSAQETNSAQGVIATFSTGQKSDAVVLPNFWLRIPKGESPTPFLDAGKYSVVFDSLLSVDLRGNYSFRAEVIGRLKLEINGAQILEISSVSGELSEPGKNVRLNKGTNHIVATFTPPLDGDALLRLFWVPRDSLPSLIPDAALSHGADATAERGAQWRHGRELFAEFRCAKCHQTDQTGMPELAMDAPAFDGIGGRLNAAWMARWIENPSENRASAHMPALFHGTDSREKAGQIASYLATLKTAAPAEASRPAGDMKKGQHLFQALHCAACHNTPGSDEKDPGRISLGHVKAKFQPGALESFLLKPEAHYAWIRMPNFRFSSVEAADLAAFLNGHATEPAETHPAGVEQGRSLLSKSGCLNCHTLKAENSFRTKSLADLIQGNLDSGCLNPSRPGIAPRFPFDAKALQDLRAFVKTESQSLSRDNPRAFALRQTKLLNCVGCHGKFEGFPRLAMIGGKLRPEWSAQFIAGKISYKPRPWLESRMPAFPERASGIAQGLANLHGYSSHTPEEAPINREMAEVGRKLISPVGGFSCISCHAAGKTAATQVFESAGINFAWSAERLLKPFYHAWVMNPLAIDPSTKMPVFFDNEGKSQLTDVYDGDGYKQIEAIWQYLRLGDKMPPPPLE
jgi:mono/diheme cytochrome c family protein